MLPKPLKVAEGHPGASKASHRGRKPEALSSSRGRKPDAPQTSSRRKPKAKAKAGEKTAKLAGVAEEGANTLAVEVPLASEELAVVESPAAHVANVPAEAPAAAAPSEPPSVTLKEVQPADELDIAAVTLEGIPKPLRKDNMSNGASLEDAKQRYQDADHAMSQGDYAAALTNYSAMLQTTEAAGVQIPEQILGEVKEARGTAHWKLAQALLPADGADAATNLPPDSLAELLEHCRKASKLLPGAAEAKRLYAKLLCRRKPAAPAAKGANTHAVGGGHAVADVIEDKDIHPHLLLGISRRGMMEFMQRIGFPQSHDAAAPGLAWVREAYGDSLTGYDLGECVRAWLFETGNEGKSVCEVLLAEGNPHVASADVFLSHVQSLGMGTTLCTLKDGPETFTSYFAKGDALPLIPFYWVDYFCLRQCQADFDIRQIRAAIAEIGLTLAEIDGARTYLTRSFCVFELFATVDSGAKLLCQPMGSGKVVAVDSAAALTRRDVDKRAIDEYIVQTIGFAKFDEAVLKAVNAGLEMHRDTRQYMMRAKAEEGMRRECMRQAGCSEDQLKHDFIVGMKNWQMPPSAWEDGNDELESQWAA